MSMNCNKDFQLIMTTNKVFKLLIVKDDEMFSPKYVIEIYSFGFKKLY